MQSKEETIKDYQERINKVLLYINDHLDDKLDSEKLASLSNFSVFHFHRIIRAYLNEPLGAFVLRLKLDYSIRLLEFSNEPINEIAYKIGFEALSSFNKSFKKRFGVSPVEFRRTKKTLIPFEIINQKNQIKKAIRFCMESIGISYDNPEITESEKCRYDACVSIKKEVAPEGEIGVQEIPGGKYEIFRYQGPYSNLGHVYNYIYRNWLPASNYKLRDAPSFDKYLNNPEKTSPKN